MALACGPDSNPSAEFLYEEALKSARAQEYDTARTAFDTLTNTYPDTVKAWISWAQMEKRQLKGVDITAAHERCRGVLLRGLEHNIDNPSLMQSLGLLELQAGRKEKAIPLLEKAASLSNACQPVLNWKDVREAREQLEQEKLTAKQELLEDQTDISLQHSTAQHSMATLTHRH